MKHYEEGRQGTGYLKKKIYSFSFLGLGMDCYLLKYPEGSSIPEHVDPVDGKNHFRLNYVYQYADKGGFFVKNGLTQWGRIFFFRPDKDRHKVTPIISGCRKVLSFGFAL